MRDEFVEINKWNGLGVGDLFSPAAIIVLVAGNLPILPGLARHQRADDGYRTLRAYVCNVFAQIAAEGIHHLVLLRQQVVNFFRLLANAFDGAACAGSIVERAVVIMTELHHHEVALPDHRKYPPPLACIIGAAARAADGAVDHVEFFLVKMAANIITPTPLAAGTVAATVAHGGIADEKKRGQRGVGGTRQIQRSGTVHFNRLALGREIFLHRIGMKTFQAGHHPGGVHVRADGVEVRVVFRIKCVNFFLAERVEFVRHQVHRIHKLHAVGFRGFGEPLAEAA